MEARKPYDNHYITLSYNRVLNAVNVDSHCGRFIVFNIAIAYTIQI